jgi:hypothetical protein
LKSISIDLSATSVAFDKHRRTGFRSFGRGATTAFLRKGDLDIRFELPETINGKTRFRRVVIELREGAIRNGNRLAFAIDTDFATSGADGNTADDLAGAAVSIATHQDETMETSLTNVIGTGYSPKDGFGLIDAPAALQQVTPAEAQTSSR